MVWSLDPNAGAGGAQGLAVVPQELFHMAAMSGLRIFVSVPEVDSEAAQNGAKTPLTLDEFPGETFQGTIVRNCDAIDLNSRTLNVEVDIDNRAGRISRVHMFSCISSFPTMQREQRIHLSFLQIRCCSGLKDFALELFGAIMLSWCR
jgi:hypothetical protein